MEITITSIHHYPGKTIINAVIDNLLHTLEISVVKGHLLVTGNDNILIADKILNANLNDSTQT